MSSSNFFVVVDDKQLKMDLDTLFTLLEECFSKPPACAVYTPTGQLNLEKLGDKEPWVISLIEEGCNPLKLEKTAGVVLLLGWEWDSIGVSSGTDGYVPIYLFPPGPSKSSDL